MGCLREPFSIRCFLTEVVRFICFLVPVGSTIWRVWELPRVTETFSLGVVCGCTFGPLIVFYSLFHPVWQRCIITRRPTILVYIFGPALTSFILLLIGTTHYQDQVSDPGHNLTEPRDINPSGFDPQTVMVIQVIVLGLIISNWMLKVKDQVWSRDLYSALVDDFLYAYDISAFFDFQLHGVKEGIAGGLLNMVVVIGWLSMFRYILRKPDDVAASTSCWDRWKKDTLCHDLPFLLVRVIRLAVIEPRPSDFLFPLKNLLLLVIGLPWCDKPSANGIQGPADPETTGEVSVPLQNGYPIP